MSEESPAGASALEMFGGMVEGVSQLADGFERIGAASQYAEERAKTAFETIGESAYNQIGTIASGAFNAYADAIETAISTGELSVKSLGAALRNMLANTLRSIGQEAAVEGAFHIAKGLGALASPATAWKAPGHFVAATQFFAVAALAGAGAGALSAGGSGNRREEPRNREDAGNDEPSTSQDVTIIGVLDHEQREELARQLQEAVEGGDL